ncbi:hypothetical protein [Martelella endophytica]|uniref:hypothetical protein n=1 Tax=Martelella endophytica TaxID=1486262 RepID=UPI000B272D4D|nr:hypothetical protein [Martelella endophytica]
MARDRKTTDRSSARPEFPEEQAKQGTTVLRTRFARLVFIGGLVLIILLAFSTMFYPWRKDTDAANPTITTPG